MAIIFLYLYASFLKAIAYSASFLFFTTSCIATYSRHNSGREQHTDNLPSYKRILDPGNPPSYTEAKYHTIELLRKKMKKNGLSAAQADQPELIPLDLLISMNKVDIVKFVINNLLTDLNTIYTTGNTLLHHVISQNNTDTNQDILILLINNPNVQVNKPNNKGVTPLQHAIMHNKTDNAKLLINTPRVDVNEKAGAGVAPLLLLCTKEYFNKDLLGLLLTREDLDTHPKCKLNNEAGQELTPYLCARYFDNKEAEEILQQDRRFNCEKGIPKYPPSSTKMKGLLYKFLQKVCRL